MIVAATTVGLRKKAKRMRDEPAIAVKIVNKVTRSEFDISSFPCHEKNT